MANKNNEIGKKIKQCREAYHLSQSGLAQKLGVSQRNISYYESGERIPPADIIKKLTSIFNVSADELLGLENPKANSSKDILYCNEIAKRIKKLSEHSSKKLSDLLPSLKTQIIQGYCTNLDFFMEDIYKISDFFGVSDEYILGGLDADTKTYISPADMEWLDLIKQLPTEAQLEFKGELKGYLKHMKESVAADSSKTGTDNLGK